MERLIFVLSIIIAMVAFYLSCSDETSTPEDTQISADREEIKDVIEIKDEVSIQDSVSVEQEDTIELKDNEVVDVPSDTIESNDISADSEILDQGVEIEDVITDTNPPPMAKIIPGAGIDINYEGTIRQIRIDATYGTLKDIKMSVPDSRVPYYLRMDELKFDLLFGDTDGSKSLSDNDKLLRIIISKDFYGETEGKTRTGDPVSKSKGEFGSPDNSATTNIEGTDYTFDFYFKKGINVAYNSSQIITGFTIYRPQKVVPSGDIIYGEGQNEYPEVLGIKADIALFMSNGTTISEMRNKLGPEDLMVVDETNNLVYYNYISIGFTAIDMNNSTTSGYVKTITLYPPYFGKIKGTSLSLGSKKSDIEAFFNPKYGTPKTLNQGDTTIYYYPIKTKDLGLKKYDICLGFIYNQNDNVTAILVGLPVEKK